MSIAYNTTISLKLSQYRSKMSSSFSLNLQAHYWIWFESPWLFRGKVANKPRLIDHSASENYIRHVEQRHQRWKGVVYNSQWLTTHVAPYTQRNFTGNKPYRQSLANNFRHAATTNVSTDIPVFSKSWMNVWRLASGPLNTDNFLSRWGRLESVLGIMFEYARDEDD